jgi:hypothetical protein
MGMSLQMFEFFVDVLILLMPIVTVHWQNLAGVLTGTLLSWIVFITSDLIRFGIQGNQVTAEDWEMWRIIWLPLLTYSLFIFSINWLRRLMLRSKG